MIIDFHTHAFPGRIAAKAIEKLGYASHGLIPQTDGTLSGLKTEMQKDGVDISVVLNIATNPKQQHNVNNFAADVNSKDGFVGFGSVHPDAPDALDELDRIKALGLKGIKFHPDYQGFFVDDERMKSIYKRISQLGLITVFHSGYDYAFSPPFCCMPDNLLRALKWFDSPVIAAHWGALGYNAEVLEKLCGEEVWFDISFGHTIIQKDCAQRIVEKHTPEKLVFGSDMPWHRPSWEIRLLESLDISARDKEKIYFRNAAKLLGNY